MKKLLSWLLCGAMVLGMIPAFTLEVEATEVDVKAETLESFGFDLDSTELQKVIADSETPYGDYTFSLFTSEELAWTYGQEATYYDTLKSDSNESNFGGAFTSGATYYPFSYGVSYITAVDFCADKEDGRDNYVAYYYASVVEDNNDGNYTNLYLTIVNAETGASWWRSMGRLPFELEGTYAQGFLAIEAGDYDGDGEDELAVYVPTNADEDGRYGKPIIAFYEVNATSCEATYSKAIDLHGQELPYGTYDFTGVSSIGTYTWENIREFPIVDLTSIEQYGSDADDLAVIISYTRDISERKVGNKYADSNYALYRSILAIYKDWLTDSPPAVEMEYLQWDWWEYGVTTAGKTGYTEAMMFAGGGAGDITGDGYYNELVVGGYRQENANDSNDNLSDDEYLVTYFNYDPSTDEYSVAAPGQWLSLDDEEYGGATDIDGGISNDSNRFSTAYSPLQITAFAERGTGYADSVLVGELVVALNTSATSYGTDYGYSAGTYPSGYMAPESELYVGTSAFVNSTFAVRFALPTKAYDDYDSRCDAMITNAVAGNFMNSSDGKEQLFYTYVVRRSNDSYNTYLGGIGNVGSGDNEVYNTGKVTFTGGNVVLFCSAGLGWQVDNATVSLAAPDRDWDGMLMRYTDTSPEYYFSDPHVLAVLQAAPYFGELVDAEYTEETGSTTISYSSGSGTSLDNGLSVSASASWGFDVGFSLFMDLGDLKSTLEVGLTAGWDRSEENSTTYSMTYSAVSTDTVVLVMTPYIRYHYEVWDRDAGAWSEMVVDMPQTPQVSQITVDEYDRVAATSDDMETIRDNLLYDSEPGDPSTYAVNEPENFESGQIVGTGDYSSGNYVKLGSAGGAISMGISAEESVSNGITWGAGVSWSTEVVAGGVFAGYSVGADYSGGYTWTTMSGVDFEGEVADISPEFAADYSFQWLFGSRTAELNDEECVVLSYVVKNVSALPRSPLSLDIIDTTTSSLTLAWDGEGVDPEYYVVYRYLSDYDLYYAIGTVEGDDYDPITGLYTYTDGNCDSDTTYAYAVKAFGYSNGVLRSGIYSPIAFGHTNPEGDTVLQITTQPTSAEIRSGKSAVFTIGVAPVIGGGDVTYIWQVYSSSDGWSTVDTSSGNTLTLTNQTEDNDGDKYRCIVMQMVGSTIYTLYSNTVSVNVGLGSTTTTLEIRDSSGAVTTVGEASATTTTANAVYSDVVMMVSVNGEGYYVYVDNGTYYLIPTSGSDAVYCEPNGALSAAIANLITENENAIEPTYSTATLTDDAYDVEEITQVQYFYYESTLNNSTGINNLDDKSVATIEGGTEIVFDSALTASDYITHSFVVDESVYNIAADTVYIVADDTAVIYQVEDPSETTCYYLNIGADTYTRVYLSNTILMNESNVAQVTPGYKAVTLTTTNYTYSTTTSGGEVITLYALVSEDSDENDTTDGYVTFVITNDATKETTSITSALYYGYCTASWTPTVAGTYSIVANYAGSSYFTSSSSNAGSFTAYQTGYSLILTSNSANISIGQGNFFELTPNLYYTSTSTGAAVTVEEPITGPVTYTVTNNTTGTSYTASSADEVYRPTPTEVGSYTITAAVDVVDGVAVSTANVTVSKNTVTIGVNATSVDTSALSTFDWNDVTYTITGTPWVWDGALWVDKTEELKSFIDILLGTETAVADLSVGSYTIYPSITTEGDAEESTYNAILALNNITTQSNTFTVTAPKHTVTFSGSTGGEVTGIIDSVVPITSGASVTEGSTVTVEAVPSTGYSVNYWTVNGIPLRNNDDTLITTTAQSFSVVEDVQLQAYFKVGSSNLTYSVAANVDGNDYGTLTANENDATGVTVNSGDSIASTQTVLFTATPEEGYEVAEWTVNGETLRNSDGTYYLNQTYSFTGMTASTEVQVRFAEISVYAVSTMAIDRYGNEVGTVTIDVEADENGEYPINSVLVLTANKPSASYTVAEWRIYAEDGISYTTVNSTSTSYTITSLQADMDIRVVFVSNSSYSLWYSVDDNGTIIRATTGDDTALVSGYIYEGGIPVVITATPDAGYKIAAVTTDDGTEIQLQTGDVFSEGTYLLASLAKDTTITVSTALYDIADAPTASLAAGTYSTAQTVNLYTSNEGGIIYYSTDGGSTYTEYSEAIEIDSTTTIYAYVDGTYLRPSDTDGSVTTFAYVIAPELVSIAVTTGPDDTEYVQGESFDSTGMVVTATNTLGTEYVVTNYSVTPDTFYTAGEAVTVTITYTEGVVTKIATVDVAVTEAEVPPVAPTEINLVSIITPDGLSFAYGVVESDILAELPEFVEMLLSDGTTVVAAVAWETTNTGYVAGNYSYQAFTIAGTATLPEGVTATQNDNLSATIGISVTGAPVPASAISVSPITLGLYYDEILEVGNTGSLTATISPSNATNQDVIWTSNDHTVATVDEYGLVTATGIGEAIITATTEDGGFTASGTVTVTAVAYQVVFSVLADGADKNSLAAELLTQLEVDTLSEDVYYKEVVLEFSTDGGNTWTTATAENFPLEGITFVLDYPDGHDKDSDYNYVILHQISGSGDIEVLSYTKVAAGLQVTVYSLSPFAVAWTEIMDDSGGSSGGDSSTGDGGGGGGGGDSSTTYYDIISHETTNGSVSTSKSSAAPGIEITIFVTADQDCLLDTLRITDEDLLEVEYTLSEDGDYIFTMPASAVEITATFASKVVEVAFDDVSQDDWFYDAVKWAVEHGVTSGTTTTTFSPYDITTRGQTVTFLWRSMEMPEAEGANPFVDVADDMYYSEAVLWAVNNGITIGTSDTTFSPDMDCSRAHIITFLWRMMGEPVVEAENPFTDVNETAYYYNAVLWAVSEGITSGTTATTFSPDKDCTRVEIVTFLYRALAD